MSVQMQLVILFLLGVQFSENLSFQHLTKNVRGVKLGKNISLECGLVAGNSSVIVWKRNRQVLFAGDLHVTHDDRITVDERNLTIENVTIKDDKIRNVIKEWEKNKTVLMEKEKHISVNENEQKNKIVTIKSEKKRNLAMNGRMNSSLKMIEENHFKVYKLVNKGLSKKGILAPFE